MIVVSNPSGQTNEIYANIVMSLAAINSSFLLKTSAVIVLITNVSKRQILITILKLRAFKVITRTQVNKL